MNIGLTGAHRTGKTTLATALAQQANLPLVLTSTSAVMIAHGYDPRVDYPLLDRLWIQDRILDALEAIYAKQGPEGFVTDRTPLDAAAYLLADIQRQNTPVALGDMVTAYVDRCIRVTNKHFSLLMLIPPAIEIKEEEGKAPGNKAYVAHIHYLINGLMNQKRVDPAWATLPTQFTDLRERLVWASTVVANVTSNITASREAFELNGGRIH